MHKDALFRGCTRPPMFLGVPYMPFFICVGGCFLLAVYFSFFLLFLIPVIILIMRTMAKRDEMIFRLLGLRLQENDGMWVFTPNSYRGHKQEP
jgi:type IV secretion system protein VirB3